MRKVLNPFLGLVMLLATLVLLNGSFVVHSLCLVGWS
jgi:hypothetical protein